MILTTVSGEQYTLRIGENIVGRGSECDLRLKSEQVSRRHAMIHWDGQRARVVDLGSTNGTRLNGRRLAPQQPAALNPGDQLEIGGLDGRLEIRHSTAVFPDHRLPEIEEPVGQAAKKAPVWLFAIAGLVVVLLGAAIVLLLSKDDSGKQVVAPVPEQTPVASGQAVVLTQVVTAIQTVAPSVTPLVQVPKVKTDQGGGTGGTASQPSGPSVAVSPDEIPPINPTTMPDLVNSLITQFVPAEMLQPLATVMPGVPGAPSGGAASLPIGTKRYGAPVLRAPADGSSYQGEDARPILEWEPVNDLAGQGYYRVIIFYQKDGRDQAGGTWTKATSYRVPVWFLQQQSGRFEWQVVITEATDLPENGGTLGATVSDPSERRWFTWTWGGGGQGPGPVTPAPSPTYGG